MDELKKCRVCGSTKNIDDFYKHHTRCKECYKPVAHENYMRRRDKRRARERTPEFREHRKQVRARKKSQQVKFGDLLGPDDY